MAEGSRANDLISSSYGAPPVRTSWLAAMVGATAGAIAFALCTLWLGAPVGIVIALVSTLHALARRHPLAAIVFLTVGTLSAFALRPSTALVLVAALVYAAGLAVASRRQRDAELLA
jgi:predicted membrane channel-forming protein YqfA (hemolysin III family)